MTYIITSIDRIHFPVLFYIIMDFDAIMIYDDENYPLYLIRVYFQQYPGLFMVTRNILLRLSEGLFSPDVACL